MWGGQLCLEGFSWSLLFLCSDVSLCPFEAFGRVDCSQLHSHTALAPNPDSDPELKPCAWQQCQDDQCPRSHASSAGRTHGHLGLTSAMTPHTHTHIPWRAAADGDHTETVRLDETSEMTRQGGNMATATQPGKAGAGPRHGWQMRLWDELTAA